MEIRRQTSYHETLTRASLRVHQKQKSTYKDKDKHRSKGNYKHPYLPGGIQAPDLLPRNANQDQENAEAKKNMQRQRQIQRQRQDKRKSPPKDWKTERSKLDLYESIYEHQWTWRQIVNFILSKPRIIRITCGWLAVRCAYRPMPPLWYRS